MKQDAGERDHREGMFLECLVITIGLVALICATGVISPDMKVPETTPKKLPETLISTGNPSNGADSQILEI